MVEGGDKQDLRGILMGLAKALEYEREGGDGESERSLLVSLLLSSVNMMLRMLSAFHKAAIWVDLCWMYCDV